MGGTLFTLTADRFYDVFEIVLTVAVSDFFSGFDIPPRPDPYAPAGNECLRIWPARMVNVAGNIAARTPVNGPPGVHFKKVFPAPLIDFVIRNKRPGVFDNPFALWNWLEGKEPQAGGSSSNGIFSGDYHSRVFYRTYRTYLAASIACSIVNRPS